MSLPAFAYCRPSAPNLEAQIGRKIMVLGHDLLASAHPLHANPAARPEDNPTVAHVEKPAREYSTDEAERAAVEATDALFQYKLHNG